jgi:hypothetical protein
MAASTKRAVLAALLALTGALVAVVALVFSPEPATAHRPTAPSFKYANQEMARAIGNRYGLGYDGGPGHLGAGDVKAMPDPGDPHAWRFVYTQIRYIRVGRGDLTCNGVARQDAHDLYTVVMSLACR